jgi:glutathione peroxidase-family protein
MKQFIVFLFVFFVTHCFGQDSSNVHSIHFNGIDNSDIDMSIYKGRQILVVQFSALNPNRTQLISLDSLYKSRRESLQVIGIPVNDSDADIKKNSVVKLLRDTLKLSFVISDISKAKKRADNNQHSLLKWISHVDLNKHFDYDIEDGDQMYMISKTGILYALLARPTILNGATMQHILENQPVN